MPMRVLLPDPGMTPAPASAPAPPAAPKKKRFPQRSAKNAEAAAVATAAHMEAQKPMAEAVSTVLKEKAAAKKVRIDAEQAVMKAAVDEANAKKAADEAAAAAAAAAIPPIVQEPPKRLKKIAPLEQPKPLAISAPSGPVEAPPAAPAPPAKVKRAPNAYALAVGKYRKEGKSFAEAAALAKEEIAKAKLPAA